jgi:pre-mRNA-splicing factor 18
MDFASLMKAQIAASKPKSKTSETASSSSGPDSKYIKRAELESSRHQAYLADQAAIEALRAEKAAKKRKAEEDAEEQNRQREEKKRKLAEESKRRREEEEEREEKERRKRLGLPDLPVKKDSDAEQQVEEEDEDIWSEGEDVPTEDDIVKSLREREQPIRLFGETKTQRNARYLGLIKPSPFPGPLPIPTSLRLLPESSMKVPSVLPKTKKQKYILRRQLASYFTLLLTQWATALAGRDPEVKQSETGRAAFSSMLSAKTDLIPLFRRLEKNEVEDAVLTGVMEIVHCAQERRYVDANKKYLLLSIGKAAWPIGVTMVGIHERSAREKLHENDKTAHIMSDEITRKFLQSIKRCLSFAQTRWPPDDLLQLMG